MSAPGEVFSFLFEISFCKSTTYFGASVGIVQSAFCIMVRFNEKSQLVSLYIAHSVLTHIGLLHKFVVIPPSPLPRNICPNSWEKLIKIFANDCHDWDVSFKCNQHCTTHTTCTRYMYYTYYKYYILLCGLFRVCMCI